MNAQNELHGDVALVTGASRGIGKAIAIRAAKDGANVVIAAKTAVADPRIPGTIYTAAEEIEKAGGKALPCIVDIRNEEQIQAAVDQAVAKFGGIDILINNASAISLTDTANTTMKRFDLMHQINLRGTFFCSKIALPHLQKGSNPHILTLSPPLNLDPRWFAPHVAYTIAKYGMSLCTLGMAEEFKPLNIAVNSLWPMTTIATAAVKNLLGGDDMINQSRNEEIMADAAHAILTRNSKEATGNFYIDEEVLRAEGVTNFDKYAISPGSPLMQDLFL
jgi:citronellol/citronellal dehydrogenase